MDNRFNIKLNFNLPKTLFLEKYNIPSLKNSLNHFNEWFEKIFPIYSRQFSNTINKTKVQNYLKYEFRQHFISHLKKLLPTTIEFKKPTSLHERRNETFRHANHHILTCTDPKCSYLEPVTTKDKEKEDKEKELETENKSNKTQKTNPKPQLIHNSTKLIRNIFDASYNTYPKEIEAWNEPFLDATIFYIKGKHEATFTKQIPTTVLDELAAKAEEYTCSANSVRTNPKRQAFYFYQYLTIYQNTAAENHNIDKMDKQQAINFLTPKLIDTDFLARVITYFDCTRNESPNYSAITKFYKEKALPEAETILHEKFNIKFEIPTSIAESLFLEQEEQAPFQ
jgi:hypothetical protein